MWRERGAKACSESFFSVAGLGRVITLWSVEMRFSTDPNAASSANCYYMQWERRSTKCSQVSRKGPDQLVLFYSIWWVEEGERKKKKSMRCLQPSAVSALEEEGRRGERTTAERQQNGRNTASVHLLVMKRPGERQVNLPGLN